MSGLDALRQALEDLEPSLDRHAIDRVATTALGQLRREAQAARERRIRAQLRARAPERRP